MSLVRRMSDLEIGGVIMSVTSSMASATQQGSQDLGLCFLILLQSLLCSKSHVTIVSRLARRSSLSISDVTQCENFVSNVSLLRRMSDLETGGVIMSVTSSLASATQQGSQDLGLWFRILLS